jgi:hypothetical protein
MASNLRIESEGAFSTTNTAQIQRLDLPTERPTHLPTVDGVAVRLGGLPAADRRCRPRTCRAETHAGEPRGALFFCDGLRYLLWTPPSCPATISLNPASSFECTLLFACRLATWWHTWTGRPRAGARPSSPHCRRPLTWASRSRAQRARNSAPPMPSPLTFAPAAITSPSTR